MKCNTKNRPATELDENNFRRQVVRSNTSFLSYASRIVYISVRSECGFGKKRMHRLNHNSTDLTNDYISRYTPEGLPQEDAEYAVDSYYSMRIRLRDIGYDPEVEMWGLRPFTDKDFATTAESAKERERRKMYLHYANTLSFYVREMWCGIALELYHTNGFGVKRLRQVFSTPVQRYIMLMLMYLRGENKMMQAEKQRALDVFNEMRIFPQEYNL